MTKPGITSMNQSPIIMMADPLLDPEKMIFDGIDTSEYPLYSVGEMAKVFFARSASWARSHENAGHFDLDDKFIPRRRIAKNARYYSLSEIEQIAHGLAANQIISGARLRLVLTMIRSQGQLWDYIAY